MTDRLFHTVTIEGGPVTHNVRVWLDGIPLKGIKRFEVDAPLDAVVEMTFTIIAQLGDVPNKLTP